MLSFELKGGELAANKLQKALKIGEDVEDVREQSHIYPLPALIVLLSFCLCLLKQNVLQPPLILVKPPHFLTEGFVAPSLGGVETLVTRPAGTSHKAQSPAQVSVCGSYLSLASVGALILS